MFCTSNVKLESLIHLKIDLEGAGLLHLEDTFPNVQNIELFSIYHDDDDYEGFEEAVLNEKVKKVSFHSTRGYDYTENPADAYFFETFPNLEHLSFGGDTPLIYHDDDELEDIEVKSLKSLSMSDYNSLAEPENLIKFPNLEKITLNIDYPLRAEGSKYFAGALDWSIKKVEKILPFLPETCQIFDDRAYDQIEKVMWCRETSKFVIM